MRRWAILVAAGAATFSQVASAADLPRKAPPPVVAPPFSWTGFYVGANVGYGWGHFENDLHSFAPNSTTGSTVCSAGAVCINLSNTNGLNGVIGGGQIGYNWQFDPKWVLGIEADFQGSDQKVDQISQFAFSPGGIPSTGFLTINDKLNWFGTVRGRLGFTPADRWLFYVTGGLPTVTLN